MVAVTPQRFLLCLSEEATTVALIAHAVGKPQSSNIQPSPVSTPSQTANDEAMLVAQKERQWLPVHRRPLGSIERIQAFPDDLYIAWIRRVGQLNAKTAHMFFTMVN